jgi:uncharacterized protein (TIGR02600 family)
MPSYYTDINAPLFVTNAAVSGTTEVFPIVDPRAADSDMAVAGFNFSNSMPGSSGPIDGIVTSGTGGLYANDTIDRLPMPVAWIYVLKDGTLTVPTPPSNGVSLSGTTSWAGATNPPTPTNPIVGRIAFWTDDESSKVNINTASEGTYWDTPIACTGSPADLFNSGTVPIGDDTLAMIEPAQHEYQRYPGHPATTCLSTVFGTILNSVSYGDAAANRAQMVKSITDAIPRISDYGSGQAPTNSSTTTLGGTQPVTSGTSVIVDQDRLYASLDEFQFSPVYGGAGAARTPQNITSNSGSLTEEENYVDTCRFFLTAHSKAPDLNMFGLPRVAIWPLWDSTQEPNARTPFDNEILRCSTVNASGTNNDPHYFCFFRNSPTSGTNDFPTTSPSTGPNVYRNQTVFAYLQQLMRAAVPGYGFSFSASSKYSTAATAATNGVNDCDQILTEIFDYIRCTNMADNSTANAVPYTPTTVTGSSNQLKVGQVVPIQIPSTSGGTAHGIGRIATVEEMALILMKVDDRKNTALVESSTSNLATSVTVNGFPGVTSFNPATQTLLEWCLVPKLGSPMEGYVAMANNIRLRFSSIKLNIGSATVSTGYTGASGQVSDMDDQGRIACDERDAVIGGSLGMLSLVDQPYSLDNNAAGAPSDSMYPTGLVVVNGTSVSASGTTTVITPISVSGTVNMQILAPAGPTGGASPGPQVQAFTFSISGTNPTIQVPIPNLPYHGGSPPVWNGTMRANGGNTAADNTYSANPSTGIGTFNYPSPTSKNGDVRLSNGDGMRNYAEQNEDVIRSVVPTGVLSSGSSAEADLRLIAISGSIPSTTYLPELTNSCTAPTSGQFCQGHSLINGCLTNAPNPGAGTLISGTANTGYKLPGSAPAIPPGTSATTPPWGAGAYGDWDNGSGMMDDGPWCNKPDEGSYGGSTQVPYMGNYEDICYQYAALTTNFSPNRQISSPVMFGSLPTGPDHPWRTLLFRPATLPGYQGTYTHPGNPNEATTLPDHLLLDLFSMPIVEPYGISEPLATSGKINLNYQIAPFTYITRKTGMEAVLKSVMITALNPGNGMLGGYKSTWGSGVSGNTSRYAIDPVSTLSQFDTRFATTLSSPYTPANRNFFVSPTEICDIPLIPLGYPNVTGTSTLSTFWSQNSLTGCNSIDRPYSLIYPRVTTKSNIFTVHVIAQSLKQTPSDLASGTWTEKVDQVTGEVRGAYTIEKYYDPNAADLSYYKSASSGLVAYPASSDGTITSNPTIALRGARWRLLNVKRFGQ